MNVTVQSVFSTVLSYTLSFAYWLFHGGALLIAIIELTTVEFSFGSLIAATILVLVLQWSVEQGVSAGLDGTNINVHQNNVSGLDQRQSGDSSS